MNTAKLNMIGDIRKQISIPTDDYLEIGQDFLRITYLMNQAEKHILLSTKCEAAEWLKNNHYIVDHEIRDSEMWLCVLTLDTRLEKGIPKQDESIEWYSWEEFLKGQADDYHPLHLNRSLLMHSCAYHEWDNTIAKIIVNFKD